MSPVQLYYMPESAPCRAVMLVAKLVGAPLEEKYLDLFKQDHLKEEYVQLNPLHKVPFIVHEGLKLSESRAIIAYLANRFLPADNNIYPGDAVKRAQVDELIHLDASIYSTAFKIYSPKLFGSTDKPDEKAEEALRGYLKYLSNRLEQNGGKKFMLSDDITIGDVTLAVSFSLLETIEYDISDFKPLVDYVHRLKSNIPGYDAISNKAIDNVKMFIKSRQSAAAQTKAAE